jgi:hypothetical protein
MKPTKRPEALPFPRLSGGSYYGEKIRQFSVGGLTLTETVFPPRLLIPAHTHENAFFCLVVRGVSTSKVAKRTRRCDASILTYHPPGEAHNTWHDNGGACLTLELEASRHAELIERGVHLDQSADFRARARHLYVARKLESQSSTFRLEGYRRCYPRQGTAL